MLTLSKVASVRAAEIDMAAKLTLTNADDHIRNSIDRYKGGETTAPVGLVRSEWRMDANMKPFYDAIVGFMSTQRSQHFPYLQAAISEKLARITMGESSKDLLSAPPYSANPPQAYVKKLEITDPESAGFLDEIAKHDPSLKELHSGKGFSLGSDAAYAIAARQNEIFRDRVGAAMANGDLNKIFAGLAAVTKSQPSSTVAPTTGSTISVSTIAGVRKFRE